MRPGPVVRTWPQDGLFQAGCRKPLAAMLTWLRENPQLE